MTNSERNFQLLRSDEGSEKILSDDGGVVQYPHKRLTI